MHKPQQVGLLLGIQLNLAMPMKKIASTLQRLGPPLAGSPVVIFGLREMMLLSVRIHVSNAPDL